MAIFRTTKDVSGYALVLDGFATLEWREGDHDRAMRIAGAAAALQNISGVGLAERNREATEFFPQELTEAGAAGRRLRGGAAADARAGDSPGTPRGRGILAGGQLIRCRHEGLPGFCAQDEPHYLERGIARQVLDDRGDGHP